MRVMYFWTSDTVPAMSGMVPYNVESLKNLYEYSFECVCVWFIAWQTFQVFPEKKYWSNVYKVYICSEYGFSRVSKLPSL